MTAIAVAEYCFDTLASIADATTTNFTQITISLPEGTKSFKSVIAYFSCNDIVTATGGTVSGTGRELALRLGAAAYTSINPASSNNFSHSGENASWNLCADFTDHFNTNWSGTSMTCDLRVFLDQTTGTTLGFVNGCAKLVIVYEHDQTTDTRIKTVRIPLDAPTGALPTTATQYDTIPNLSTRLGEGSKVFKSIFVEIMGNEGRNTATVDHTMTIGVGSNNVTTGNYEAALATDRFFSYIYNVTSLINTGATQAFNLNASVASRCHHLQATLIVTYEYSVSGSSSVEQSLLCPFEVKTSLIPSAADTEAVRTTLEFYIEEPATITTRELAAYLFWSQTGTVATFNGRLGTGSYVAYTDAASVVAGSNCLMIRNDSAFTLVRGKNTITLDFYNSDTGDRMWGSSGYFIINYTSGKSSQGIDKHNKSIPFVVGTHGTGALTGDKTYSAYAPNIPETGYYINWVGFVQGTHQVTTAFANAYTTYAQITSGEGAQNYIPIILTISHNDTECGLYIDCADFNEFFKQWPADARTGRYDIETARDYRQTMLAATQVYFHSLVMWLTYHSITFTAAGDITGSSGGSVDIELHRESDGLVLATTSRTGNGAYSMTYYDNTEACFVEARESGTLIGRSDDGTLSGSP